MGIKITASGNVSSACKLLPKMIQYICKKYTYVSSGIYLKPFSAPTLGGFMLFNCHSACGLASAFHFTFFFAAPTRIGAAFLILFPCFP